MRRYTVRMLQRDPMKMAARGKFRFTLLEVKLVAHKLVAMGIAKDGQPGSVSDLTEEAFFKLMSQHFGTLSAEFKEHLTVTMENLKSKVRFYMSYSRTQLKVSSLCSSG